MTAPMACARVGVTMLEGSASGLRQIDSMGSILQVRAGPLSDVNRIKDMGRQFGCIAYAIDATRLYLGRGDGDRDVGDRVGAEAGDRQVYLMGSSDPRFDMRIASYIEAQLINYAARLSIPLANIVKPYGRGTLEPCPDLEQLVQQALLLLSVAGLKRFEDAERNQPLRPVAVSATSDLHDVRIVEPEELTIPDDAVRMQLVCRDLQAEGFSIGDRFLVLPGADYSCGTGWLSKENHARRAAIADRNVVAPLPGLVDRSRLTVGLDCPSSAIAAKIVTGKHVGNNAWRKQPPEGLVPS